ncbi:MAG: cytochrome c peroxidase, partial [Cocleimonas sp.]
MKNSTKIMLLLGFSLLATACGSGSSNSLSDSTTDTSLRTIINNQSLTGNPMAGRSIPNINSSQAQLGMRLFFSKALGGDRDSACVTCHHPSLGGGDDLSLPIGVGAVNPNL